MTTPPLKDFIAQTVKDVCDAIESVRRDRAAQPNKASLFGSKDALPAIDFDLAVAVDPTEEKTKIIVLGSMSSDHPSVPLVAKAATVIGETVTVGVIVPVDFALIATPDPENAPLVTKVAQAAASTNPPKGMGCGCENQSLVLCLFMVGSLGHGGGNFARDLGGSLQSCLSDPSPNQSRPFAG
jgi:hypothetical protein